MTKRIESIATANPGTVPLSVPNISELAKGSRGAHISRAIIRDAVRFVDLFMAVLSGIVVGSLYLQPQVFNSPLYWLAIGTVSILAVASMQFFGLYRVAEMDRPARLLPKVFLSWINVFAVFAVVVFFLKAGPEFSRVWIAAWCTAGGAAIALNRLFVASLIHRWTRQGRLFRRAVVFGSGEIANNVLSVLKDDTSSDLRVSGIFDDRDEDRRPVPPSGFPVLGDIEDLVNYARLTRLDVIIVALPMSAEERLSKVVRELSQLPVDIKLPASASPIRFSPQTYSRVGKVPMIDLASKPITAWGGVAKLAFDKIVAAAALIALLPVFIAVAAAIRMESKGPVFFRQKRYGFNNELIEIFKFRSMYTDRCDANANQLVTKGDPRVTGVGRFIRKTSIDELPQLLNVLRGELSLVGPRPHALSAKAGTQLYDEVVDGYFARHKVKPGITGWAQINGWRGETDTPMKIQKRVECDLYYIENWSVLLDLYILLKTPLALLKTDNAY